GPEAAEGGAGQEVGRRPGGLLAVGRPSGGNGETGGGQRRHRPVQVAVGHRRNVGQRRRRLLRLTFVAGLGGHLGQVGQNRSGEGGSIDRGQPGGRRPQCRRRLGQA